MSQYYPTIMSRHHQIRQAYKAKADAERSDIEKIADWMTINFGSVPFLLLNAAFFSIWIMINTGLVPGVAIFDPFPFGFLTMIVSLEAIFLAIIVLISQNRAQRIDEIREEIDLQVNTIAETEVTKILKMLKEISIKQNIDLSHDEELQYMLQPVDSDEISKAIASQI